MTSVVVGPLCVVCGRQDRAGAFRKSGFKCFQCRGEPSDGRLRGISSARGVDHATVVTGRSTSPYSRQVVQREGYVSGSRVVYRDGSPYRDGYVHDGYAPSTRRVVRSASPVYTTASPRVVEVVREPMVHREYDTPVVIREGSPYRERSPRLVSDVHVVDVLDRENSHLATENRRLRQREIWLAEARAAHRDGMPCEWCERHLTGTHSHPCPFNGGGSPQRYVY